MAKFSNVADCWMRCRVPIFKYVFNLNEKVKKRTFSPLQRVIEPSKGYYIKML